MTYDVLAVIVVLITFVLTLIIGLVFMRLTKDPGPYESPKEKNENRSSRH